MKIAHLSKRILGATPAGTIRGAFLALSFSLSSYGLAAEPANPEDVAVPAPIQGKGYKLIKNWDFGKTVNNQEQMREEFWTRYVYNNGTLDTLNKEWQRFRDNDNHVFDKEVLKLTARITGGLKRFGIESGMLRSKWIGRHGYFECRMKVPRGRGMWPAFWLNPEDQKWPPEIDIVEIVNNGRDTTKNSYHILHNKFEAPVDISTKLDKWKSYKPGFDYADDFHVFAVEWTPETVTHYVDGVEVAKRKFRWTHTDGTDGGNAHVLVNLSVGGKWPGDPQSVDDFPAELALDYIRVWQIPEP